MEDSKCGTCIWYNGDIDDETQFCDEKEIYVSKSDYCSKYKEKPTEE